VRTSPPNSAYGQLLTRSPVGFTGSGQEMTKDQARTRHVYQANEELE
jgi:hypothetical protein